MAAKRIRIELDEAGACALHAALTSVLASEALNADQTSAARGVLEQLDRRVPKWEAEEPEQTVLAALAEAEAQGRGALAEEANRPHWRSGRKGTWPPGRVFP